MGDWALSGIDVDTSLRYPFIPWCTAWCMSLELSAACLGLGILDRSLQQSGFRQGTQACVLAGAGSWQTSSMPLHLTTFHLPWKFEKQKWWIYPRLYCVHPFVCYVSILCRENIVKEAAVSISLLYLLVHCSWLKLCLASICFLLSWNMCYLVGIINRVSSLW